jgi:hypothetical protein
MQRDGDKGHQRQQKRLLAHILKTLERINIGFTLRNYILIPGPWPPSVNSITMLA